MCSVARLESEAVIRSEIPRVLDSSGPNCYSGHALTSFSISTHGCE